MSELSWNRAISIHVPREGDDADVSELSWNRAISIHVPCEGDDGFVKYFLSQLIHFNPRPP